MQFIGHSLPVHHFFDGTVSQAVFYINACVYSSSQGQGSIREGGSR